VIWGYSWVATKVATQDASALVVAASRSALGAAALLGVLAATGRSLRPPPFRATLVYGLLQTALFTVLITAAVSLGDAGKSAILAYTMPLWLALLAWRFLGERLAGGQRLALALAAVGVGVLVPPLGSSSLLGNGLAVAGGAVWAASAVWAVRVIAKERLDLLSLTAWQMVWGALVLVALALVLPVEVRLTTSLVLSVAFLAVFANALGWALWLFILSRLPAGVAGLGSLATPVVGLVLAAIQLGELPSPGEAVGIACIVAALGVHAVTARNRSPTATPRGSRAPPAPRPG
jgi:drug/metabolite transporter (DMT)-like permease